MNNDVALEIKDLCFEYNQNKKIFCNFNLSLEKGKLLILKGKSGSGKSTLINLISGILPFSDTTKGEIKLFGKPVCDIRSAEMVETLGVVFQTAENRLIAPTVREEIFFGLQNICLEKEEILKRTEDVLKRLNISELKEQNPHQLSGGQIELVTIAAVLALKPKVYIFDEILSQLDTQNQNMIIELVRQLVDEGATVIMADHTFVMDSFADMIIDIAEKGETC